MWCVSAAGGPGPGYGAMLVAAYIVWALASVALASATSGLLRVATRRRPGRWLAWYLFPVFAAAWAAGIYYAVTGNVPFARPPANQGPAVNDVPASDARADRTPPPPDASP